MATDPAKFRPPHEVFAEKVCKGLEQGTEPFVKPWAGGLYHLPRNPASGTTYQGVNRLMLSRHGYADPRWVTLKQANEEGYWVQKGQKSQPIVYWQWDKNIPVLDAQGKPVLGEDGKPLKETVQLERPRQRYYSVFHMSQLDGDIPPFDPGSEIPAWDRHERAAAILKGSGAVIKHDQRDRAFYRGSSDDIHLPPLGNFDSADKYYATALHELMHWSGHASRLNREKGPFGSEQYAREELRAEIASWMLGLELGIGHDPGQHLSYVGSWIKVLKEDPYEIVRACRDAEKMKEYVLAMEHKLELGKDQEAASPNLSLPDGWSESRPGGLATNKDPVNGGMVDMVMLSDPEEWFVIPNDDGLLGQFKDKFFSSRAEVFTALKHAVEQSRDGVAPSIASEKTFLHVPFEEKDQARAAGAKWDADAKKWFAPEGADLARLQAWRTAKAPEPVQAMDPRQEFAQALRAAGLDLGGQPPVMDGQLHRVPVIGGKLQARDGAYKGFLDGRPAGWYQNHKTGEQANWKATGHTLTPRQKEELRREGEERARQRQQEREMLHDRVADMCARNFSALPPIVPMAALRNPYLLSKGIHPLGGIKETSDGKALLVPLYNAEGNLRNVQEIDWSGNKLFQAGGEKQGCFLMIDPEEQCLHSARVGQGEILLAEGYATGVSLHMATGRPVAVAFDAGNLEPVAKTLREKFPEAKIAICADNDHKREHNVGVEKAVDAGRSVHGCVIVPDFTPEEREKGLTDFNDLHQARGLDAVKAQVTRTLEVKRCGMER